MLASNNFHSNEVITVAYFEAEGKSLIPPFLLYPFIRKIKQTNIGKTEKKINAPF